MRNVFGFSAMMIGATVALSACDSDANIASRNISKAADMFEINRRVVFYNGITDNYILTVEGRCSIDLTGDKKLAVTCKTGPNEFKKHFLGLSDNVTFFAEQIVGANVDTYHYRVVFKPAALVPSIDFRP